MVEGLGFCIGMAWSCGSGFVACNITFITYHAVINLMNGSYFDCSLMRFRASQTGSIIMRQKQRSESFSMAYGGPFIQANT